jgi:hypothetical protein
MKKLFILSIISLIGFSSCKKKNVTCERKVHFSITYNGSTGECFKNFLGTIIGDLPEGGVEWIDPCDNKYMRYTYETDSMILYTVNSTFSIEELKYFVDNDVFYIEKEANCY